MPEEIYLEDRRNEQIQVNFRHRQIWLKLKDMWVRPKSRIMTAMLGRWNPLVSLIDKWLCLSMKKTSTNILPNIRTLKKIEKIASMICHV